MPTASQLVVVQGAVMERASWVTRVNNDLSAIGGETVSAAQGFKGDFSHKSQMILLMAYAEKA
jgi:hypothetical protein